MPALAASRPDERVLEVLRLAGPARLPETCGLITGAHRHHHLRRQPLAGLALFFGGIAPRLALVADPVYPAKPVAIVVPFPPGGPSDAIVCAIAEQLGQRLGQPFSTAFKDGAAGVIGTGSVAKAAPDGYTLLAASSDMLVNNTATFQQLPYDPLRDLTLVTQVGSLPLVLAVHAGVPVDELAGLAAYARQQRGQFAYGSWGQGTHAHLAAERLLNRRLGADAVHAVYRGLAPMTQDLVGQRVAVAFGVASAFAPFVQARILKVIAVTGTRRVAAFREVRTIAEQGHDDEIFQFRLWMALAAPAGTPLPVVERLHREMAPIVASAPLGAAGQRRLRAGVEHARAGPRGAGAGTGHRVAARAGDGRAAAVRAWTIRQKFGWRPLTTLATMPASQRPPRRHGPDRALARSPAADRS